jgi:hypothetical protein
MLAVLLKLMPMLLARLTAGAGAKVCRSAVAGGAALV